MAYFIETHDVYKALTDDVQTLVMEEWDPVCFADWLHGIFGHELVRPCGIVGYNSDDFDDLVWTYEDTAKMPPPDAHFYHWCVRGDEKSVQIFTF